MAQETKVCKYCQTEIPKKAKICPNCRKKQGPKIWLIVLIVVIVLAIIGSLAGESDDSSDSASNSSTTDKKSENTAEAISYTAVTASELESILQDNALKASETYKDQYIEVSGYLEVIDSSGEYISIDAGENDWTLVNIQCFIKNDDQKAVVMEMSTGDSIVVKGKCTDVGEVLGYWIDIDEIIVQ